MRALLKSLCLTIVALPAFAQERVTVAQLEQKVTAIQALSDGQAAQRLSELELTERLSQIRLERMEASLPGATARKRLSLLADASAFYDLPASELPLRPPPDHATQTHLLSLTHDYVINTLLKLPNFFATRQTSSFVSTPADARINSINTIKFAPYEQIDHSTVTVLYRDRRELIAKGRRFAGSARELRTVGEFGPILVTVLNDCAKGGVVFWNHWEKGPAGPQATFRYQVPQQASHYLVTFPGMAEESEHYPGYHGEIALNPADGSILRLTVIADLDPNDAMSSAGLAVYYGPTEIGGIQYICAVKSIALATVRRVVQGLNGNEVITSKSLGPRKYYLNDVRFTDYHIFRSELRILTGDDDPDLKPPAPLPPNAPSGESDAPDLRSEADLVERAHGTRYTVGEFERALSEAKEDRISDQALVRLLSSVQVTERISSAELTRLEAQYPAPRIKSSLVAIADLSAVLDPPPSDILATPAPTATLQASLLSRAMDDVHKTDHRIPILSATRETVSFEDIPAREKTPYQPLKRVGNSTVSVAFSDGHEAVQNARRDKGAGKNSEVPMPEFVFMLPTVVADAAKGEIDWDHWEKTATGNEAVFSYEVSGDMSHFFRFAGPFIGTGRAPGTSGVESVEHDPGYHGQISISLVDGSIRRLSVIAEVKTPGAVSHADYVVDYAPMKIEGASDVVPVKGVMIELRPDSVTKGNGKTDEHKSGDLDTAQTEYLNDVTYTKYSVTKTAEEH